MLIVSATKSLLKKGDKVQDIKASILSRGNRKFWYVKYQVFFENDDVKTGEESTKVLKTEKTLKYMQTQYLSAWIARKQEELKVKKHANTKFNYYGSLFLIENEKLHDYKNTIYRLNRILKDFGELDIRKITKLQIKQWLNSLLNSQSNTELTKNSKLKYLRVFHGIFELALDDNVLDRNFTYDIKLMGEKRNLNSIRPFTKKEVNTLLEFSDNSNYGELLHCYLGIAFNQGMSPSEILGLQVSDVNIHNQTITIKRNITKGKVKETKTIYRDRTIPIFDSAIPYVTELLFAAKKKCSLWLLSDENGLHLYDIENIRGGRLMMKGNRVIKQNTKWYKLLNDLNIEYRDIKNCRHTFAVNAIESKAFTMQEIANLLGHGSLKMLIEHYAKWVGGKALEANTKINLYGDTLGDTDNYLKVLSS